MHQQQLVALTTWVRKYGFPDEVDAMREAIRFRSAARQAIIDMDHCGLGHSPAACAASQRITDASNQLRRIAGRVKDRALGYS